MFAHESATLVKIEAPIVHFCHEETSLTSPPCLPPFEPHILSQLSEIRINLKAQKFNFDTKKIMINEQAVFFASNDEKLVVDCGYQEYQCKLLIP